MHAANLKLTAEGRQQIERDLEELRSQEQQLRQQRLSDAGEAVRGDIADMAQYAEVQWEQARIEARIAELEGVLAEADLPDEPVTPGTAGSGSTVTVRGLEEVERYTLVTPAAADPRHGRISVRSPVGEALLGRRAGETVEVATPGGPRRLKIEAID